jgi:hypothetical protein
MREAHKTVSIGRIFPVRIDATQSGNEHHADDDHRNYDEREPARPFPVEKPCRHSNENHLRIAQDRRQPGADHHDGVVPEAQVQREDHPTRKGKPTGDASAVIPLPD